MWKMEGGRERKVGEMGGDGGCGRGREGDE